MEMAFLLYFRETFFGAPILIIKMILQLHVLFRNSKVPFPDVLFETEFEWAFSSGFQPKFTQHQQNANYLLLIIIIKM